MTKNIAILTSEEIEYPKDYRFYSIQEIEKIENNKYDNIYIGDLIDYLSSNMVTNILQNILNKLKDNGKIHIKAPDILQLCWYCSKLQLDLTKFRYVVYQTGRKSCYSIDEIILVLKNISGIEIESASYTNGYEYSITANKINE